KRVVDRAPRNLREELQAVQETVRSSLDEVRQVARRLRPGVLEDLGLLSALSALAAEFSRASGVPVERRCDPDLPELSSEAELVIYRIAQESLTNISRHAKASRVWLTLTAERGMVRLRITDDGRGGVDREGAGIRGMRERALLIGARLSIDSPPGEGTEVLPEVPLAGRTAHRGGCGCAVGGEVDRKMTGTRDAQRTVTRILLADDHALVRRGLRLILDAEPDLTVVAEAADGAEAVAAAREGEVDLAILDIAMPRMTG